MSAHDDSRQDEPRGDAREDVPEEALGDALKAAFDANAEADSVLASLAARPVRLKGATIEPAQGRTGRYQMVGELARGGVGIVYKGRDVDLGRDVAMKVMSERHVENEEIVERFVEEAQIGGQLQHPGIVPVYELGLDDEQRPYFAMKLVKGKTLAALLTERQGPDDDLRRFLGIFEQVCETMAYAHARGVIHRDLKPANIMIGAFGEVQVVDWGFAKVLGQGGIADERRSMMRTPDVSIIATMRSSGEGSESIAGSVMGTPAYMPPEQALGEVESLDERSDVFSLGAILVEILLGRPPYTRDTGDNLLVQAAQCRTEQAVEAMRDAGIDEALVDLVAPCLGPRQSARPKDAAVLSAEISGYLAGIEARAQNARVAAATARIEIQAEQRKRRLTVGIAAAVLAVLMLGGGLVWSAERGARNRESARSTAMHAALREATLLIESGEGRAALEAAERAVALGGGTDAHALVAQATAAAGDEAWRARESALHDALADLYVDALDETEREAAEVRFAEAFRAFGLVPDSGENPAFTLALRARPAEARRAVATQLLEWARLRATLRGVKAGHPLVEIAVSVDPLSDRVRLVRAFQRGDWEAVREMEAAFDPAEAPLEYGIGLASAAVVRKRWADVNRLTALLEKHHPHSFAVHRMASFVPRAVVEGRVRLRHVRAALALAPKSAPLRQKLAARLSLAGRHEEALAVLEDLVRDIGQTRRRQRRRALILSRAGRHADAREALEGVRPAADATKTEKIAFARADFDLQSRAGKPEAALAAAERQQALDPEAVDGNHTASCALLALGRYADAEPYARKAVAMQPQGAIYHMNLGFALKGLGKLEAALVSFREAARLDPTEPEFEYRVAATLYALEQYDECEAIDRRLKAALEGRPGRRNLLADVYTGLIGAIAESGREEEAIKLSHESAWRRLPDFDAVSDPATVHARQNQAVCLRRLGHWEDAAHVVRPVAGQGPEAQVELAASEPMLPFERTLAVALAPGFKPSDVTQASRYAIVAEKHGCFHAAARLWRAAFDDPLANTAQGAIFAQGCVSAARSAIRAAAGHDMPTQRPGPEGHLALRKFAYGCLERAHGQYERLLRSGPGRTSLRAGAAVRKLLKDHHLDSVHTEAGYAKLPAGEPAHWKKLWKQFEALLK